VADILDTYGRIDVLVNNAGRSIRRPVVDEVDRVHDVDRTVRLNYEGPVALILATLPSMLDQGGGQVVNVSSIGTQWAAPSFAAYVGSKSALDGFTRVAAAELAGRGIAFSTVYLPLVRTPMIESSLEALGHVPSTTADQAGDLVCDAIVSRAPRVSTRLGMAGEVITALAPDLAGHLVQRVSDHPEVLAKSGSGSSGSNYWDLFRGIHRLSIRRPGDGG
jgi:NAD(P)-dependent dehydrogenase (short-subunit alcohol dehydrogenase family)